MNDIIEVKTMFVTMIFIFCLFLMILMFYNKGYLFKLEDMEIFESFSNQTKIPISLIFFYTDWSPIQQETKEEWDKLMNTWKHFENNLYWSNNTLYNFNIQCKAINCSQNKKECQSFNINSYPTIVLSYPEGNIEYRGKIESSQIQLFLFNQLLLLKPIHSN